MPDPSSDEARAPPTTETRRPWELDEIEVCREQLDRFSTICTVPIMSRNPGPCDQENGASACGCRLTERHLPDLIRQLKTHAAKWREIGVYLRFQPGELNSIEAKLTLMQGAPLSWLSAMLSEWLQWAPGDGRGSANFATLEGLKRALSDSGLGATSLELHISGLDTTSSSPNYTDADFSNVDSSTVLDENNLNDVKKEIYTLAAKYYQLGITLGIPVHDLEKLQKQYGTVNYDQALIEVILLWLRGRTSRTWQALVRAVDSKSGVNDHPLALKIAGRHLQAI